MNNRFAILFLVFVLLTNVGIKSQESPHVLISVHIESNYSNSYHGIFKQELFEQVSNSVQNICNATADTYKLFLDKEQREVTADLNIDQDISLKEMLLNNLNNFAADCNEFAAQEGYDIIFYLEPSEEEICITIFCKEIEPELTYWETLKNGLSTISYAIADKAKIASSYIKDASESGAEKLSHAAHATVEKVSDAAQQVKESAKENIHHLAEKVSEETE